MYVREAGVAGSSGSSSPGSSGSRPMVSTNLGGLISNGLFKAGVPIVANALSSASQDTVSGDISQPSSAQVADQVVPEPTLTGDYASGNSSAQQARDDNLGILNQLLGTFTGENQKILQDLQAAAAKAQYDYSERLSSTAYQRAVADMKKAGLNPAVMFAASQGNAASTPQVGIANVATENQLISGINSAASVVTALSNVLKGVGSLLTGIAKL